MKKKYLLSLILALIFFVSVSSVYAQTSSIPYWTMDVTVDNRLRGTFEQKEVFFFRDIRSMEALTGFPRCDSVGGNSTGYQWRQPTGSIPVYIQQIFAKMRSEGFGAAFILNDSGTSIYGDRYWTYHVFLMQNGIGYFDGKTRYNNPVSF